MSYRNSVISALEKALAEDYGVDCFSCLGTRRRCLDWERASIVDYDESYEERNFERFGETEHYSEPRNLIDEAQNCKSLKREPTIRYFLDGSRRTYKIEDISLNNRCLPIVAGQVGVGVCKRTNKRLNPIEESSRILTVLALPQSLDRNGKNDNAHKVYFNSLLKKINEGSGYKFIDEIVYYDDSVKDNLEDKAIAAIQSLMIEEEKNSVKKLVQANALDQNNWLLKDGSLEYAKIGSKNEFQLNRLINNYKYVIGVSKSFNPELARLNKRQSASLMIARLKMFHRTPVFMYKSNVSDGIFAIWYLRIRESEMFGGRFDGVLKLEKLLISPIEQERGLDSREVDKISAWVINERTPVCYGKDSRWLNHLYPIWLTELYIKSKYMSSDHFIHIF